MNSVSKLDSFLDTSAQPNSSTASDSEPVTKSSFSLPEAIATSAMLSEMIPHPSDSSDMESPPLSPDSAEESILSLPNIAPGDTILEKSMPPRPSSDGDRPSSTTGKTFKCNKCPYETDRKNNLKRHVTTMHDPAPSTLDCCGTRFATKGDLREHTRAVHGAGYTCRQCGHTFCRRALLQRHQSVHSGLKAFSCSKCGYQSSHKSNMQRHMQVHLQPKQCPPFALKERFKSNLKLNFRSSIWKYGNIPSKQSPNSIDRSLYLHKFNQDNHISPSASNSYSSVKNRDFSHHRINFINQQSCQRNFMTYTSESTEIIGGNKNTLADIRLVPENFAAFPAHDRSPIRPFGSDVPFNHNAWKLAFNPENHNRESSPHVTKSSNILEPPVSKILETTSTESQRFSYLKERLSSNEAFLLDAKSNTKLPNSSSPVIGVRFSYSKPTSRSLLQEDTPQKSVSSSQSILHRPIPRYGQPSANFSAGKLLESEQFVTNGTAIQEQTENFERRLRPQTHDNISSLSTNGSSAFHLNYSSFDALHQKHHIYSYQQDLNSILVQSQSELKALNSEDSPVLEEPIDYSMQKQKPELANSLPNSKTSPKPINRKSSIEHNNSVNSNNLSTLSSVQISSNLETTLSGHEENFIDDNGFSSQLVDNSLNLDGSAPAYIPKKLRATKRNFQ